MKAKVSVVIPNYNGKEFIESCMDSLMEQDGKAFEIIIVDDASSDDSLEAVMAKYPDNGAFPTTKYIKHETNEGFCKSVNDGIKAAETEYILLLNNDTTVDKSFVREMYNSIRRSDKIFSVSAKMISMHDHEKMDDCGDYYNALGYAFTPCKDKPVSKYEKRRKVFSACGGAAIYRKSILDEIGLFDELHFAYLEDVDIGYRARLHGYINIYEPNAIVYHYGSGASGSRYNAFKAELTAKNNIYLISKNMPLWQKVVNGLFIFIGFAVKTAFYTLKGHGKAYIKGLFKGIKLAGSSEGKAHRQDFSKISLKRQFAIEGELLLNMLRQFAKV